MIKSRLWQELFLKVIHLKKRSGCRTLVSAFGCSRACKPSCFPQNSCAFVVVESFRNVRKSLHLLTFIIMVIVAQDVQRTDVDDCFVLWHWAKINLVIWSHSVRDVTKPLNKNRSYWRNFGWNLLRVSEGLER